MEKLLENKIINTFENETSTGPVPFYTKNDQLFFKNKLISVEEIIHTKDCSDEHNEEFRKHFSIYKPAIEYILTFEDQYGNTHSMTCNSKPKKIDEMFYYIIEDNHVVYITHETYKASLMDFINIDEHERYTGISNEEPFFINHHEPISFLLIVSLLATTLLTFFGFPLGGYKFFLLGLVGLPIVLVSGIVVDIKTHAFYRERNKLVADKTEALLKTFE